MEIGNVYECITQFELPKWNYGRDEFEDEIILVEKGSVWSLTGQEYMCEYRDWETDRKSTRLNSSHSAKSRMPSSA